MRRARIRRHRYLVVTLRAWPWVKATVHSYWMIARSQMMLSNIKSGLNKTAKERNNIKDW